MPLTTALDSSDTSTEGAISKDDCPLLNTDQRL